jgi:hypothetical protein
VPLNPLKDVAFHSLGSAYSFGYVVCGVAAGVSALLVLLVLRADPHHDADELAEVEAQLFREPERELQYA